MLNVEMSIVKKPFAFGRERWGWGNRTSGRGIALQKRGGGVGGG